MPKTLPTNIKFIVGGKEFFQRVLGVCVPGTFFPYLLSLSATMGLVHGQALRRLATCGQCPVPNRIKVIASTTMEVLFFDDVKSDNFLSKNSEEIDEG